METFVADMTIGRGGGDGACRRLLSRRGHGARLVALAALASTVLTPTRAEEFPPAIALDSLDGETGFRADGVDPYDLSGQSVAGAGDIDGDGFDDVVIGAYRGSPGGDYWAGESYVVFGKAAGFDPVLELAALDGTDGFTLDGFGPSDNSGFSVAGAGDVNGDGFDDLVIGAEGGFPQGDAAGGEGYVVFGKGGFEPRLSLSNLDGNNGFRFDGAEADHESGHSVAVAGDVNGDGFDDIAIGSPYADPDGDTRAGATYVLFGKAGGFPAKLRLGRLDGNDGFRLDGVDADDHSGASVAGAGDFNGDGLGDILVGAYGAGPRGNPHAGASYVVFGKSAGFEPTVDLSSLYGEDGFRLDGIDAEDESGFVASAGDMNGDGFDDVVIGAPSADPGGNSAAGESYVVFGKASGFTGSLDLATLDGRNGFRLDGMSEFDGSGFVVAGAGDVNADGFDDVMIGAPIADPAQSYVVFGKAGAFAARLDLSALDGANGFRLDGSGRAVAGAGDVNGDGFDDVLIGSGSGESYVVFGRAPDGPRNRVGSRAGQYISGGAFADALYGRAGDDLLEGRGAGDVLDGGIGEDTASYKHASAPVAASLGAPDGNNADAAGDDYPSIENLAGSRFADRLTGNRLPNRLAGLAGGDVLIGGAGEDVLVGGAGADLLVGGSGGDTYVFAGVGEPGGRAPHDRIKGFEAGGPSTSVDLIDLRQIDARTDMAGDQAFDFIGAAAFSGVAGELRVRLGGAGAIVSGDVDGDTAADFHIMLLNFTDLSALTASDFKL